ncbi:MAG: hypothetical protein GYB67_12035, partial [Chloroflexi bacterium]|nr:hypothetical protein [Chloroflexota bacterium]
DRFNRVIESMQASPPGEPRADAPDDPGFQQAEQFIEFVLKGDMDSVLGEIEKARRQLEAAMPLESDDPDDEASRTAFQQLAADEPPIPSLEESGTVTDLMTGVTDSSFQNVLSILRGEVPLPPTDGVVSVPQGDLEDAFEGYYQDNAAQGQESGERFEASDLLDATVPHRPASDEGTQPQRLPPETDDTLDSILARVILETALEDSEPSEPFSLEELVRNIEQKLPQDRRKVQPLPSWIREVRQRLRDDAAFVREPDFLPDDLPEFDVPDDQATRLSGAQTPPADISNQETSQLNEAGFPEAPWLQLPDEAYEETPVMPAFDPALGDTASGDAPDETAWPPATETADSGAVGVDDSANPWDQPLTLPEFEPPFDTEDTADSAPVEAAVEEPPTLPEFDSVYEHAAFQLGETAPTPESEPFVAPAHHDDPYLAQLALSLTDVSLELTAEATLLTRADAIVAFAGAMEHADVEELRDLIAGQWETDHGEARIRFVTLMGSGREYMLYSRRTEDDFTLSLVFAGATSLRDIRKQARRLIDALQAVPEQIAQTAVEIPPYRDMEPEDVGPLTPYAYVWMLRDPNGQLDDAMQQAISSGLGVQLRELAWEIDQLQVQEDFVYLLARVPGDTPPYMQIDDLKARAAALVHAQNDHMDPAALWADSYLIVTPGRPLDVEEIQQFINFERML